jgi:hypothetical protein
VASAIQFDAFVESVMSNIVAVLAASSQILYQAQIPSFGCNTSAMISELQHIRLDEKAFEALLSQKAIQGDCVQFMKGSVVEGEIDDVDPSVLRVQTKIDPPGYLAPTADFELKEEEEKNEKK